MSSIVSISNPSGINELPEDVLLEIFSHLDDSTLFRIEMVCKRWGELSNTERVKGQYERIFYRKFVFFGPEDWKKHFGDPGTLPKMSYKQAVKEAFIFASKWPKEWDKKMVWLQPKKIFCQQKPSEEPEQIFSTPIKIGELVAAKLGGNCDPSGYQFFWDAALREHGDKPVEESCWVYMTPDILLDSPWKKYKVQETQAKDFGGEVPELTLAVTGILLKCLVTGKRLFRDKFTRCKESAQGRQLVVGGFAPAGLGVYYGSFDDDVSGVAVLRKFKAIGT